MAQAKVPAKIFSANWNEIKEDLGFATNGGDPVVQAIARFQDAVRDAALAVQDQRRENPHADAPLPRAAEELVAECGDSWVKTIRKEFTEVFKFARHFRGSRFPVFIYGREQSPYSKLLEGFLRDPKLVGIEQEGFSSIEHRGHPFPKKDAANG